MKSVLSFDFDAGTVTKLGKNGKRLTAPVEDMRYTADPQSELSVAIKEAVSVCNDTISETVAGMLEVIRIMRTKKPFWQTVAVYVFRMYY